MKEYFNEEEMEYLKKTNNKKVFKFVLERLKLENLSKENFFEMVKIIPEDQVKKIWDNEVFPKLVLEEAPTTENKFINFIEKTPLATLKIKTYSDYELYLGTTENEKKEVFYTTNYYLRVVNGNFFDKYVVSFTDEDGIHEETSTKLRMAINLRINYAYREGDSVYVSYNVGKNMTEGKERINEINQVVDVIRSIYHLSPKDCYYLRLYLDSVVPDFLKFDRPSHNISIENDIIHIDYPINFDEKKALEGLIKVYDVTVQKELMSFLSLYAPILPFNEELRKREMKMYLPLIMGQSGGGKSSMVKFIIVKGFDNPKAEKSEDDIFTRASFRENFTQSSMPIMIDEITEQTMFKLYGAMKNLATGRGTHSRGRPQGGLNEWKLKSIPIFTTNENIYIDSGMETRFFKLISNDVEGDIQKWREAKKEVPVGYQYIFLKEFDGMSIDEMEKGIIKYVKRDEDFAYAYQLFVKEIMDKVFERYNLKCPFKPIKKLVVDDNDWYVVFGQFIKQQYEEHITMGHPYLKLNSDYELGKDGYFWVTKIGFQKFLKIFQRCPYRVMSSFAMNSPKTTFDFVYKKKRVCGSKNPLYVIGVREKNENEKQVELTIADNTKKQLDSIIEKENIQSDK